MALQSTSWWTWVSWWSFSPPCSVPRMWRFGARCWVGSALTRFFFSREMALGLFSELWAGWPTVCELLVTLLIWIYYSSQILLFGAEFTQVYANRYGAGGKPSKHAVAIATTEQEISRPGRRPANSPHKGEKI